MSGESRFKGKRMGERKSIMKLQQTAMPHSAVPCHRCGENRLTVFPLFEQMSRVTSDSRPWPLGGKSAICQQCALIQKVVDDSWRKEVREISESYCLYHQSVGQVEQIIFNEKGEGAPRSQWVLGRIMEYVTLPETGRMIDIGCGNGPTLRAFSEMKSGWSLFGYEPYPHDLERVLSIPDVRELYTGKLEEIPGFFDLITVSHVLEHVENPVPFLRAIRELLAPSGILSIQIPYFIDHIFDVMSADHCSHYTLDTLADLLDQVGFMPIVLSQESMPREITVIANRAEIGLFRYRAADRFDLHYQSAQGCFKWLGGVLDQAREGEDAFGVFGTSIGGNWLVGALGDRVTFFVDEDPARAGTQYRGRPIYHPRDVPADTRVIMPLHPKIANRIIRRLKPERFQWVQPPPYDALSGL